MPTWILTPRTSPFLQHLKMYLDFSPSSRGACPIFPLEILEGFTSRAKPHRQEYSPDRAIKWSHPGGKFSLCSSVFNTSSGYHCAQENYPVHLLVIGGGGGAGVSIPAFTLKWKSSGELDYSTSDLSQVPDGLSCNRHRIPQTFLLCPDHVLNRDCVASRPAWFSLEIPESLCLLGEWQ